MLEIKDIIEQCQIPELPSGKKGRKELKEQIFKWNEKYSMLDGQIMRNKFLERGSVLMEFLSQRNRFLDEGR